MSKQTRWDRRDTKRQKRRHGMRISGRSLLTILDIQRKRAKEIKHDEVAERS